MRGMAGDRSEREGGSGARDAARNLLKRVIVSETKRAMPVIRVSSMVEDSGEGGGKVEEYRKVREDAFVAETCEGMREG